MVRRLALLTSLLTGLTVSAAAAQAPAAQTPAAAPAAPAAPLPTVCGPNVTEFKNVAKDSRCFEMRTYTVQPGGQGSLELLHKRFREETDKYFKKHGMTAIAYWQPLNKPETIIYILAYKDMAARNAAWAAFNADPGWLKARADMMVTIKAESVFMSATDYSPMK